VTQRVKFFSRSVVCFSFLLLVSGTVLSERGEKTRVLSPYGRRYPLYRGWSLAEIGTNTQNLEPSAERRQKLLISLSRDFWGCEKMHENYTCRSEPFLLLVQITEHRLYLVLNTFFGIFEASSRKSTEKCFQTRRIFKIFKMKKTKISL